jgi:hypothetical protein
MTQLIHCIYASTAESGFNESDIPALLTNARMANEAKGITGMLLYIEGSFFQVLEGDASNVDEVFHRISRDPRHSRLILIIREPISNRSFGDWTMGCSNISALEAGELIGENDFFRSSECVAQIGSGRAKKLLAAFRGGSWQQQRTDTYRALGRRHVLLG